MNKNIEFEGLKLKTSFNFKNKIQRGKYFNNLLIESIYKFQEEQKEYFSEKLHVIFSYHIICKYTAFIIFVPSLFVSGIWTFIFIGISLLLFLTSLILYAKFKTDVGMYAFTVGMNDDPEFIESIREELIKDSSTNIV